MVRNSTASAERYAHLSDEETIETGESVSKRLYGYVVLNADKNADKWTFEKVANQQTLGNAGGSAGSRTPDHLIKSQMLYQLSYRPNATISVT